MSNRQLSKKEILEIEVLRLTNENSLLKDRLEHGRGLIFELGENLKAAEDQNHYHKLMCEYRDRFYKIEKDIKEVAGLLLTTSYSRNEQGEFVFSGNEGIWIESCGEILKPYFKRG